MLNEHFPFGAKADDTGRIETLGASLNAVRHQGTGPVRFTGSHHNHWLELALSPRPRNLTACFPELRSSGRFERLGDLLFIPANVVVELKADGAARHAGIVCEIEQSAFRHWTDGGHTLLVQDSGAPLDIASNTLRHLLRRLAEEVRSPGVASSRFTEALFVQISIELARYCAVAGDGAAHGGLAGWRLRLIDERLTRPGKPPSLSELADMCGMSSRQLTRGFRASRGCSLGEYQLQLRLDAAKRRLEGKESVKEISASLGFASPSRFAAAFRRSFAITPLQFRQRVFRQ